MYALPDRLEMCAARGVRMVYVHGIRTNAAMVALETECSVLLSAMVVKYRQAVWNLNFVHGALMSGVPMTSFAVVMALAS